MNNDLNAYYVLVNDIDASNIESVKNEVMKVVTEKTNQSLQTAIFNILNRKKIITA